jgi:hypothetical protein
VEKFKRDMAKVALGIKATRLSSEPEESKQGIEEPTVFTQEMIEEIIAQRKRGLKLKDKTAKSKNPVLIEAMASHF